MLPFQMHQAILQDLGAKYFETSCPIILSVVFLAMADFDVQLGAQHFLTSSTTNKSWNVPMSFIIEDDDGKLWLKITSEITKGLATQH